MSAWRSTPATWWDLQATFRHEAPDADRTPFPATLVELDGRRLATGKDFGTDGAPRGRTPRCCCSTRRPPTRCAAVSADRPVPVRSVEAQALHPPPVPAVHDLDAAAGGRPQAAVRPPRRRCRPPSASTRTATSPTCAPTRTTLSDTALSAARSADRRAVRRRLPARRAPPLPEQGEERPGGPRGDPPRRRRVPHPRRALRRASTRPSSGSTS